MLNNVTFIILLSSVSLQSLSLKTDSESKTLFTLHSSSLFSLILELFYNFSGEWGMLGRLAVLPLGERKGFET